MFCRILFSIFIFCLFSCASRYGKTSANPAEPCGLDIKPDSLSIPSKLSLSAELLEKNTGAFSLENGGVSLITRAWLCEVAKRTLDVQYYIFSKDNTGLIACDFLVRAADRGVKVRIIVDDATMKAGSSQIYAMDSHKNIEIKIFNPGLKVGSLGNRIKRLTQNISRISRRMHNKSLTIDDEATIIGGRNIADEYFDYSHKYNFRDRDVLLFGQAVRDVKSSFELYWNSKFCVSYTDLVNENKKKARDPKRFDRLHHYACDEKNFSPQMKEKIRKFPQYFKQVQKAGEFQYIKGVSFVADIPGKNEDRKEHLGGACLDSLLPLLQAAKTSVDIQSPYLILTDVGKKIFSELVARGVRVRVLTNSLGATDNYEAFSGYQRDRNGVLKTGIEVYEFKPNAEVRLQLMSPEVQAALSYTPVYGLHSKTMIIDDKISVIGSFNLDPRSTNLNSEVIAIFRSAQFTKVLSKYVNEEFLPENCWHITEEFNPDSQAGTKKNVKARTRKIFPKRIL